MVKVLPDPHGNASSTGHRDYHLPFLLRPAPEATLILCWNLDGDAGTLASIRRVTQCGDYLWMLFGPQRPSPQLCAIER